MVAPQIGASHAFVSPIYGGAQGASIAKSPLGTSVNAQEEITFTSGSSKADSDKSVRRDIHSLKTLQDARLLKVKQVLRLLLNVPKNQLRDRLFAMARRLDFSKKSVLAAVQEETSDSVEQMLILQVVASELGAESDSRQYQEVLRAQQMIDEQHTLDVRSRLHALDTALRAGKMPSDAMVFSEDFLAFLLAGSFAAAIDEVLKRFKKRLRDGLNLTAKVLGEEISVHWPYLEPEQLQLIRANLAQAASVATVLDEYELFFSFFRKEKLLSQDDPVQITRDMVKLAAEPWVIAMRFSQLADKYIVLKKRRARLRFLIKNLNIARTLPDLLFLDVAARARVLDAAQQAVDIEAEQETL